MQRHIKNENTVQGPTVSIVSVVVVELTSSVAVPHVVTVGTVS